MRQQLEQQLAQAGEPAGGQPALLEASAAGLAPDQAQLGARIFGKYLPLGRHLTPATLASATRAPSGRRHSQPPRRAADFGARLSFFIGAHLGAKKSCPWREART